MARLSPMSPRDTITKALYLRANDALVIKRNEKRFHGRLADLCQHLQGAPRYCRRVCGPPEYADLIPPDFLSMAATPASKALSWLRRSPPR